MGFLSAPLARKASNSHELWLEIFGSRKSKTGKTVGLKEAVGVSAVFANLRVIGNGMAQVPLKLMQEQGRERRPAREHSLYKLMAMKPNRWQTSFQWRQMLSWHVELTGNHFSYVNRLGGRIIEIYPFQPGDVEVIDLGRGEYEYRVTAKDGSKQTFPAEAILHIRGPSWDGGMGLDILKYAREAIGLSLASEESAASLHKNGVNASGTYSVDGNLTDEQHKLLMAWIKEYHAGSENTGMPMILDRAAKWQSTQMTGRDAQALETRKYQIEEVCRFFGTMPIMVGYSDKTATYASAEQMFLAHIVHTLSPRWTCYEQIFDTFLLTEKEREAGYYFDFVEEGMIRGSIKDTKDTILGYVNGGVMKPNEGRAKLDLPPDDDPASDKLRIPVNTVTEPEPTEGAEP